MFKMFKNIMAVISVIGGIGLIIVTGGAIAVRCQSDPTACHPPPEPAKVLTAKERERADCIKKWKIQEFVFTNGRERSDWNDFCEIEGH